MSVHAVDLLWLETLGRVAGRAAHEVKGALNGVSVNLEVVRSRAERPDAPASVVRKFADSAAQQLEALIRMNDALLALARPVRGTPDAVALLGRLTTLLGPSTAAEGGRLVVEREEEMATVAAPGNAVRLALAAPLLGALERKAVTTCRVARGTGDGRGGEVEVRVESSAGGAIHVAPAIIEALASVGIRTAADDTGCALTLPAAGTGAGGRPGEGTR